MPDIVIEKLTRQVLRQGYIRGEDPSLEFSTVLDEDDDDGLLPGMVDIVGEPTTCHEPVFKMPLDLRTSRRRQG